MSPDAAGRKRQLAELGWTEKPWKELQAPGAAAVCAAAEGALAAGVTNSNTLLEV